MTVKAAELCWPASSEEAPAYSDHARESHFSWRRDGRQRRRILLVLRDDDARALIRYTLESAGYKVIEALDGEDGARKLRADADGFHLLLLDMVTSRENDIAAYREIMKAHVGIKALFISSYKELRHNPAIRGKGKARSRGGRRAASALQTGGDARSSRLGKRARL